MKRIIGFSIFYLLLLSCSEKKPEKAKDSFLVKTSKEGYTFLDITRSKYYPKVIKSNRQVIRSYGIIKFDSINNGKLINVKFWLSDSSLRQLAEKENISYYKSYMLDTTYKKDIFNFNKGFEIKPQIEDTAIFQIRVKDFTQTEEELRKKYSMRIHCHFEDKNGIVYDTTFLSRFNRNWMQE